MKLCFPKSPKLTCYAKLSSNEMYNFGGDNMAVPFDTIEDPRLFYNLILLAVLVQILLGLAYFQL